MASTAPTTLEKPIVVLYWLEKSRSQRILWLLEELKVDYELKIFHRNPKTHLAPPRTQAKSGFITEYLLEHFADGTTLLPKRYKEGQEGKVGCETEEWMRYKFYMHYAEGSLMTFMVLALVAGQIKSSPVPFFIKPITGGVAGKIHSNFLDPNFITHFNFLEEQLTSSPGGGKYLCGPNLTGADILLSFPLLAGRSRTGLTKEKYPKLYDYIDRMEAEPGYKKSVAKIIEIDGKFEITV
ncbi:glutathione S-transferase [Leptodontidium sp. MPI-SDFR-AT-0119]|nr:glutathione S-transferase [Leptodontidium sp. MPI-SDFR-AT-0119]